MPRNKGGLADLDADELLQRYEDGDSLDEREHRFLQDWALLPKGLEPAPVTFLLPDGTVVANDPAYHAQQALSNQGAFDAAVQARAEEIARDMILAQQHAKTVGGENHGNALNAPPSGSHTASDPTKVGIGNPDPDDDDVPPYGEWKNEELRAEIAGRNAERDPDDQLSIDGKKDELVARLEADDEANADNE